jgi:hypothetical protein
MKSVAEGTAEESSWHNFIPDSTKTVGKLDSVRLGYFD